jgi:hypothetical protein
VNRIRAVHLLLLGFVDRTYRICYQYEIISRRKFPSLHLKHYPYLFVAETISAAKKTKKPFFRDAALKAASWGLFTNHSSSSSDMPIPDSAFL